MKTLKTIILVLLVIMSTQSFSQSRFSKRKYMKGIFNEKYHRIKIPTSDQEVTEPNICEEAAPTKSPDTVVHAKGDTIFGIVENAIAVKERPTPSNKRPLESIQSVANDDYGSIPKHNTTNADQRPYAGMYVSVSYEYHFQAQKTKSSSRLYERTFREKVIEWLKNNGMLWLLGILIFVLAASAVGFWGALVVLAYIATVIFLVCLMIMGLIKLLIPGFKIF